MAEPLTNREPDERVAEIAKELRGKEFYGLANDRIAFLLKERRRLAAECVQLTEERDERLMRESGLALIAGVDRWQRAYAKKCDEAARYRTTLDQIASGYKPEHSMFLARAALAGENTP